MKPRKLVATFFRPIKTELTLFITLFFILSNAPIITLFVHKLVLGDLRGLFTSLSSNLAISYICVLIVHIIPWASLRTFIKFLLYTFILLIGFITVYLRLEFQLFITPTIFDFLMNTDKTEATEFLSTFCNSNVFLSLFVVLLVVICTIIYFELRYKVPIPFQCLSNRSKGITAGIFIITFIFGTYNLYSLSKLFTYNSVIEFEKWSGNYWRIDDLNGDPIFKTFYSFRYWSLLNDDVDRWIRGLSDDNLFSEATGKDRDLKLVMVIGESFIKHHSNLYGYNLVTNPSLTEEYIRGNLTIFNNAITSQPATNTTIHNLLCTNNSTLGENWRSSIYFPLLFSNAGWNVYFWDNQTFLSGDKNIYNAPMVKFLFNDYLLENCYTKIYDNPFTYDHELIMDFQDKVNIGNGNDLIIFHLMGQHVNAAHRYPHTFDIGQVYFTADEIHRDESWITQDIKQAIAHYDNATLYNDYVISQIIDIFRDKNAIITYFSDHGEEVYDYRNSIGRKGVSGNDVANYLKYQFEIPFMIWESDEYIATHPTETAIIKESTQTPVIIDDFAHLFLSLGGISTTHYKESRNFLSDKYTIQDRIVKSTSEKTYNFDRIMDGL